MCIRDRPMSEEYKRPLEDMLRELKVLR